MHKFDVGTIENDRVDYKVDIETTKPKSWLKSVSAFANTNGGCIVFGVTDDTHEMIGLDNVQDVASKIAELISSRVSPLPRYQINEVNMDASDRKGINLIIENGPDYPYYYIHEKTREPYVRHGDRSEVAKDYELNNLILKGKHRTFDSMPSRYMLEDVSFTLLAATYKKETGDSIVIPRDLVSMQLVEIGGTVNNAGLLLCDQGMLSQSRIFCTRWKGVTKGSIDGDALDDKELRDESLISLLKDAEAFIRNNSKNPWTVRGMRREETSDYPFKAVREVLVNAIMHRDYQILGSEIHVDMFDNRLEIVSPGGMLNGAKIQDLNLRRVPSMRRNDIISDFFGRLNFMDRRGSGIGRILDSYDGFIQKPDFSSDSNFFYVMLPNRSTADSTQIEIKATQGEKTQLLKDELLDEKINWEVEYFHDLLSTNFKDVIRNNTIKELTTLYSKYTYEYTFNRRNISSLIGITENAASRMIKKACDIGIMKKVKQDEYCFVSPQIIKQF